MRHNKWLGNLTYLLKEYPVSNLYDENSNDNVGIVLALEDKDKTSIQDIQNLKIKGSQGAMVPVSDLVKVVKDTLQHSIYRKDQKRVVHVTADNGRITGKSRIRNFRNKRRTQARIRIAKRL